MEAKYDFYCEEVLSNKTKVEVVFESENILAFNHTKPSYKTHIVIIPKKHIIDLISLADDEISIVTEILKTARDISKSLDKDQGIKLITNLGKFQDTPHLHFHLIVGDKL
ncbi:MAG: HIT domain-containing protein [Candidatus Falkowbacteria bacterium]|nr:HIT domain-containing protein [Candidatus Falkowbacteria bacterium]